MRAFIVILDGLILACSFYTLTSAVAYTHKWLWESKRELKHEIEFIYRIGCDFTVHLKLSSQWISSQICVWRDTKINILLKQYTYTPAL